MGCQARCSCGIHQALGTLHMPCSCMTESPAFTTLLLAKLDTQTSLIRPLLLLTTQSRVDGNEHRAVDGRGSNRCQHVLIVPPIQRTLQAALVGSAWALWARPWGAAATAAAGTVAGWGS